MSNENSVENSPYSSTTDLRDDDPHEGRSSRKGRRNKGTGVDLDDVESVVRTAQQDTADLNNQFGDLRSQSQGQTRRIHDLMMQFEEARALIDKIKRKSHSRSEFDGGVLSSTSLRRQSSQSSMDSAPKSEISVSSVTESVVMPKQSFGAITLTVKVDEDTDA